jgi:hypothetical protein
MTVSVCYVTTKNALEALTLRRSIGIGITHDLTENRQAHPELFLHEKNKALKGLLAMDVQDFAHSNTSSKKGIQNSPTTPPQPNKNIKQKTWLQPQSNLKHSWSLPQRSGVILKRRRCHRPTKSDFRDKFLHKPQFTPKDLRISRCRY